MRQGTRTTSYRRPGLWPPCRFANSLILFGLAKCVASEGPCEYSIHTTTIIYQCEYVGRILYAHIVCCIAGVFRPSCVASPAGIWHFTRKNVLIKLRVCVWVGARLVYIRVRFVYEDLRVVLPLCAKQWNVINYLLEWPIHFGQPGIYISLLAGHHLDIDAGQGVRAFTLATLCSIANMCTSPPIRRCWYVQLETITPGASAPNNRQISRRNIT